MNVMGFRDTLKKILGRKSKIEALESDLKRFNTDLKRSNERSEALQSATNFGTNEEKHIENYEKQPISRFPQLSQLIERKKSDPIELQKESLQLGVAAGYTGKSIREIESSLNRIETQMTSKDWFVSNYEDKTNRTLETVVELKKALEKHDLSASERFNAIQSALKRMSGVAMGAPEPIRRELMAEIESIQSSLPLTPRMEQLVNVVKMSGKLSYDDLEQKMNLSRSALRGLLANTTKRTNEIERFSLDGNRWVRYVHPKTTQISDI